MQRITRGPNEVDFEPNSGFPGSNPGRRQNLSGSDEKFGLAETENADLFRFRPEQFFTDICFHFFGCIDFPDLLPLVSNVRLIFLCCRTQLKSLIKPQGHGNSPNNDVSINILLS